VRTIAAELGFDLVRFGPADPGEHGQYFLHWLEQGRHGEMQYLEHNRERILDPTAWRPGVRSAIALAVDYGGPPGALPDGARIARYATGRDYHRWLRERVFALRRRLEAEGAPHGSMNGGTDAVPVLERAIAARAGIGFLAKSAMVISPTHGPYLQLAELLTGLDLPPDPPAAGSCGSCTACLQACPTGAIVAPFQIDARRCLSYTTIEQRGFLPPDLRQAQADWLFGCDICLEVCPFTKKSPRRHLTGSARPPELQPHRIVQSWTLVDILELDPCATRRSSPAPRCGAPPAAACGATPPSCSATAATRPHCRPSPQRSATPIRWCADTPPGRSAASTPAIRPSNRRGRARPIRRCKPSWPPCWTARCRRPTAPARRRPADRSSRFRPDAAAPACVTPPASASWQLSQPS
jgi:epoxyqueuosine reductase